MGGADDIVRFEVTMTYPRIVPLGGFLGWSNNQTITQNTVLRNQPFAGRTTTATGSVCSTNAIALLAKASRVRASPRALRGCTSGVAMIEFALALPVLTTLGLCGLETANYAMAHLRVSNIAMLTADNAARVRESIDEANIIELFTGAKMSGDSINFRQNGRIILSTSSPTRRRSGTSTGQWIRWQRCDGAKVRRAPITARRAPARPTTRCSASARRRNPITAAPGTAVMLVEVVYNYQPIISNSFFGGRADPLRKRVQRAPAHQPDADQHRRVTPRTATSSPPERFGHG